MDELISDGHSSNDQGYGIMQHSKNLNIIII